jgi:hypothetical protein
MSLMRDVTLGLLDATAMAGGLFQQPASRRSSSGSASFRWRSAALRNGMVRSTKTFSVTTGFKGNLTGNWDYEAALSHSQYQSRISWAQIIAAKANDLFPGPAGWRGR